MKKRERMHGLKTENSGSFFKVALSSLPLFWALGNLREAAALGAVTVLSYWALTLFYYRLGHWFPMKVRNFSFILTVAVLSQISWYLFSLTPLWIMSVILLTPQDLFKKKRRRKKTFNRDIFKLGFGFFALLVCLGLCKEIFFGILLVRSFGSPAGMLFLLTVAAILWQNQPLGEARKKELS